MRFDASTLEPFSTMCPGEIVLTESTFRKIYQSAWKPSFCSGKFSNSERKNWSATMAKSSVQSSQGNSIDWNEGFPIAPHDKTRLRCQGWSILRVLEDHAEITCDECGTIIRTVSAEELAAVHFTMMSEKV